MTMAMNVSISARIGGKNLQSSKKLENDALQAREPTVAAAKAGTCTTQTDENSGVLTMDAGHGFATSDKIDFYWTDPTTGRAFSRRDMTATVSGNLVTLDGGSGDDFPVTTTVIAAMKPHIEQFDFEGDDCNAFACYSPKRGNIRAFNESDVEVCSFDLQLKGNYVWFDGAPYANPLAGETISYIKFSHGQLAAVVMTAGALHS